MKNSKTFRTLFLTGITVIGTITIFVWLPVKLDRQRRLDADLLVALDQGNVQEVRSLLNAGADPNARDLTGLPPISLTAHIRALFTRPTPPEIHRASALSCATNSRKHDASLNAEMVKLLLDHGANVKRSELCDAPPLVLAAESIDIASVSLLLDHGADPNVRSLDGRSVLRVSIESGYVPQVNLLLKKGAQINLQKDDPDLNDLEIAQFLSPQKDPKDKDLDYAGVFEILKYAVKKH